MGIARTVLGGVAVAVIVFGLWAWASAVSRPAPEVLQGQVEGTLINVSGKLAGRLASIEVREGQRVARADLVARLEGPDVQARLDQARAARDAAAAQRDKAYHGAREEEVRQARSMWERACHGADLAERSFRRLERLNDDGVVPAQRRDEAEAQWKTARDAQNAARAALDMAESGARDEDKAAAAALVDRAAGAISEVNAAMAEMTILAPAAGEVYRRNAEPGEVVPAGYPVVTLLDPSDTWVVLQLREDRLAGAVIGTPVTVRVPALGDRRLDLEVSYIAPMGDFATWRPSSAQGGFDLKTFEVRARPRVPVAGLRPGMSAIVVRGLGVNGQ
jgi:HlyD family secretion protein